MARSYEPKSGNEAVNFNDVLLMKCECSLQSCFKLIGTLQIVRKLCQSVLLQQFHVEIIFISYLVPTWPGNKATF